MERIAPWFAVVLAAAIAVLAVFEIDMRSEEDELAIPTSVPSPSGPTTDAPTTMGPTMAPTTSAPAELPAATETPQATVTATVPATAEPTEDPTEAPTVEPTAAATTAPPVAAEPMPHTGGGALTGGLALLSLAGTLAIAARRRS